MRKICSILIVLFCLLLSMPRVYAEEKQHVEIPDYVVNISKENTYPNPAQDVPHLQPSPMAKKLLNSAEVPIKNPTLVRMLNESTIHPSKLTLGFKAKIFLGRWPLNYESKETSVNWEFQQVNVNQLDNHGKQAPAKIHYEQKEEQRVSGDLTAKVDNRDEVKKMMMMAAARKSGLPLAFRTIIGKGTKKSQVYSVPINQTAFLYSYVPAVNEKGKVTYGEVYLVSNGRHMKLVVKNLTHQGIGAWIPLQDHLSLQYRTSK